MGEIRQEKVNSAHYIAVVGLGALVHYTPPDEVGPVRREYGNDGRVLGPITGVDGNGSNNPKLLRGLVLSGWLKRKCGF